MSGASAGLAGHADRHAVCDTEVVDLDPDAGSSQEDEDGASLRAAGWMPDATVRGRGWHSKRRARSNTNAFVDKVRWSRTLYPKPAGKPPPAVSAVPGSWPGWLESSQAGFTL